MSISRVSRVLGTTVLATVLGVGVAGASSHATLKLSVPAGAKATNGFTYTASGTFSSSVLTGPHPRRAYVAVLYQPASYACKANAFHDWVGVEPSRKGVRASVSGSPFRVHGSVPPVTSAARLCGYLYSRTVSASNFSAGSAKLIATASLKVPYS